MRTAPKTLPGLLLTLSLPLFLATVLSGCMGTYTTPPPVFTWDIPLPPNDDQSGTDLVLTAGGQAVVPVTLVAHGEALAVNLSMDYEEGFPDGIQVVFSTPYENIAMPAGSRHIAKITFTASRDVPPGTYRGHLIGRFTKDVNGMSGIAREIDIVVTEPAAQEKMLPAYALDITFPGEKGTVTIGRGSSITLPVAIRSLAEVPLRVRLGMKATPVSVDSVGYQSEESFLSISPGESATTSLTILVGENAPVGDFQVCIEGELAEPVAGYTSAGDCLRLIIP